VSRNDVAAVAVMLIPVPITGSGREPEHRSRLFGGHGPFLSGLPLLLLPLLLLTDLKSLIYFRLHLSPFLLVQKLRVLLQLNIPLPLQLL